MPGMMTLNAVGVEEFDLEHVAGLRALEEEIGRAHV